MTFSRFVRISRVRLLRVPPSPVCVVAQVFVVVDDVRVSQTSLQSTAPPPRSYNNDDGDDDDDVPTIISYYKIVIIYLFFAIGSLLFLGLSTVAVNQQACRKRDSARKVKDENAKNNKYYNRNQHQVRRYIIYSNNNVACNTLYCPRRPT